MIIRDLGDQVPSGFREIKRYRHGRMSALAGTSRNDLNTPHPKLTCFHNSVIYHLGNPMAIYEFHDKSNSKFLVAVLSHERSNVILISTPHERTSQYERRKGKNHHIPSNFGQHDSQSLHSISTCGGRSHLHKQVANTITSPS